MSILHTDPEYMQRKLDHYNAWLLDPDRPLGTFYPGFPEDIAREAAIKAYRAEFDKKRESNAERAEARKAKAKTKAKRAHKSGGFTKQARAVEIFKQLDGNKSEVIAKIQSELGMSLAGATTYFYNAKKLA